MQSHMALTVAIALCASCLGSCSRMPVAPYSSFGDPANTRAWVLPPNPYAETPYDGAVLVIMEPRADRFSRRKGLSIQEFQSPTGSNGKVFIHYPKGIMEMRLVVYDVNKADSDMVFKWRVVQNGQLVQSMEAKVLPGPPVRVFVDGQEIDVVQE